MGNCYTRDSGAPLQYENKSSELLHAAASTDFKKDIDLISDIEFILLAFEGKHQELRQRILKKLLPPLLSVKGSDKIAELGDYTNGTHHTFPTSMWNPV